MSDISDIGLNVYRKVEDIWRAGKSESLVDYTKPARVSPLCLLDADVMFDEITPHVMQSALSLFAGYYLQAWSISMSIGKVDVMRHLDKLNPDRSPIDSATHTGGLLIATEGHVEKLEVNQDYAPSYLMNPGNYKHGLPTPQMRYGLEAINNVITGGSTVDPDERNPLRANDFEATTGQDVRKELRELSNLAYGKMLAVDVTDGQHSATINVSVRLATSQIASDRLVHILSVGQDVDMGAKDRWYGFKSGRLAFIKDILLCEDRIQAHRQKLAKDTDGLYASMLERQNKNRLAAVLSGNPSVAQASAIFVLSLGTAQRVEREINGKLKDFKVRERLLKNTACMLLIVIDKEYDRATFYHKGIPDPTQVSKREMESANKGSGPNVSDILKAYSLGSSPSL